MRGPRFKAGTDVATGSGGRGLIDATVACTGSNGSGRAGRRTACQATAAPDEIVEARGIQSIAKAARKALNHERNVKVGHIDHLMIDKPSGQVTHAVMSFGGFLELAHSHYPIPWTALKYDTNFGGYITGITEEQLKDAPTFSDDSWGDRNWKPKSTSIMVHRCTGSCVPRHYRMKTKIDGRSGWRSFSGRRPGHRCRGSPLPISFAIARSCLWMSPRPSQYAAKSLAPAVALWSRGAVLGISFTRRR